MNRSKSPMTDVFTDRSVELFNWNICTAPNSLFFSFSLTNIRPNTTRITHGISIGFKSDDVHISWTFSLFVMFFRVLVVADRLLHPFSLVHHYRVCVLQNKSRWNSIQPMHMLVITREKHTNSRIYMMMMIEKRRDRVRCVKHVDYSFFAPFALDSYQHYHHDCDAHTVLFTDNDEEWWEMTNASATTTTMINDDSCTVDSNEINQRITSSFIILHQRDTGHICWTWTSRKTFSIYWLKILMMQMKKMEPSSPFQIRSRTEYPLLINRIDVEKRQLSLVFVISLLTPLFCYVFLKLESFLYHYHRPQLND